MKKIIKNTGVLVLILTLLSAGTAISVQAQTVKAATKFKVTAPKKIKAGKKAKIKTNIPATFKSSNKNVATVNKKGVVTAKNAGTVKITVTAKKSNAKKTVKITVTKKASQEEPDDPVPKEPSTDFTLTAEYKGKIPKGSESAMSGYGAIVKVKRPDGTEEVLPPGYYYCYPNGWKDVFQRDGKEFRECVVEHGDISTRFDVEVIEVGNEIPLSIRINYKKDIIEEGEELESSNMEIELFYKDRSEILNDNSEIKFLLIDEGSGFKLYEGVYEKTYNYNGEDVYVCIGNLFNVYYE